MRPQERPLADASGFLGLVPQTASALEEAARRLGENAEALLSRVNRIVEVRVPDRMLKSG